ncbi:response regulator [Cohnella suwonensis]|uniref:Response regulator n=1 Tax=Cohnella suwonensis TaxID=696072 RepID=A0ABW0LYK4_9BACL
MRKIKVLLVEDDPFWQENITNDLSAEADIELVAVAAAKEEAIAALGRHEIDVILMDIQLSENRLDGIEVTRYVRKNKGSRIKIIMITSLNDREVIMGSFKSGAVNYIKKSSFRDLIRAIREADQDRASIHADVAEMMRTEIQLMELTTSEREIFELKRQGLNKVQIAEKLHKSLNTVKTQFRSIRDKLFH